MNRTLIAIIIGALGAVFKCLVKAGNSCKLDDLPEPSRL